jgi:hypothetical protein
MTLFSFDAVSQHIREKHPGCADFAVEHLAKELSGRKWKGVTLGRAVGIIIDGLLRHQMTEYETLLLHGVDRKEARRQVQPKIDAMLRARERRPIRNAPPENM